jgi:iron complex transport system substrate-binding protein
VRIVSLLPSTTEILFALGAGDQVVGVTFECDFPAEARNRRVVSNSALPTGLTPAEIDQELVVTQDLCAVCAVELSTVDEAMNYLGCDGRVLTIDPSTLEDVVDSIAVIAEAIDCRQEAARLTKQLRERLGRVASRCWSGPIRRTARDIGCPTWSRPQVPSPYSVVPGSARNASIGLT